MKGQHETKIDFRLKKSANLGILKKSYAKRFGIPKYEMRFLFDGRRISDAETPNELDMEQDDVIEVYPEVSAMIAAGNRETSS